MKTGSSATTILIVDDEPENLNVLEASLSSAGYRVALFPRGDLALEAAREKQPSLVLLDIRMPGMDGYEVCRRLKADERTRAIPVLFISALTATEDIAAGFACGGVDYIPKPFRETEVLARVRTHLALRQAYVDLAEQHSQLKSLEQQRDSYVHMLVHDMRSPLHAILGHLQLIESDSGKSLHAADLHSLRSAIYCTHVLSQMTSTVIDLSRMESVSPTLHPVALSAEELFRTARSQALDPSSPRAISKRITPACPALLCDADLCTRIVINLFANAIKYSPSDSEIVFGAEPDPAGVRVWVRDQGPGIPAQYHARIFEKFGVVEQSFGARLPSTGLGLAFCKMAVKAHGGTIGIESAPGKGSTFWFTLPAAPPARFD